MSSNSIWKKIGIGAAVAGGVIAGVALIPITLGFGGAGIVAGSVAAGIQAAIGNVTAGSIFAVCTSLGMTGVFASTAAVGVILGAGGLAAYIKGSSDSEKDAKLMKTTIDNKDNPDIIIKILEIRFPDQRDEIRKKYEELYPDNHFDDDILNYVPINLKIHVENMLLSTSKINAFTLNVKLLLDSKTFKDFCDMNFEDFKDAKLIASIIDNRDNPLMIVRLLNYRNEDEREKIDKKFRERKGDMKKKMLSYIVDYMSDNPEISYIHILLDGIK